MYYINGFIRRLMETAGLESIILDQTDSQFAYIHRRDIMSIMHMTIPTKYRNMLMLSMDKSD